MIPCRIALRRLERRAEDELPLDASLELDGHLAQCERCAARARALTRLDELLGALPEPTFERCDVEGSLARVWQRIDAAHGGPAQESPPRPRVARRRWVALLAAAGLLLAALGIAARFLPQGDLAPRSVGLAPEAPSSQAAASPVAMPSAPPSVPAGAAAPGEPGAGPAPRLHHAGPSLVLGRTSEPDPVRLLAVQAFLRRELIAAGDPALVAAPPAWRGELDRRFARFAAPLAREGWPVERIVSAWLTSRDGALAGAAARFVGPRADSVTLRRLEQALESGADPLAAARALAEAGAEGQARLARRALHAEHGTLARAALLGLEPAAAAARLAEAVRASGEHRNGSALASLASDLAGLGPAGARALLALGEGASLPTGLALEALARAEGAAEAALLALEGGGVREFVPLAAARLAGARALARLVAFPDQRADAIAPALAWIDDPRAFEHVARLAARERLAPETFGALAASAAARHPRAAAEAARNLARAADPEPAARWLEALAAEASAAALPAIEALLLAPRLPAEVAFAAALALGGSGLDGAADVLEARLAACSRRERHLAAASLAGIARLRGAPAAERWLMSAAPRAGSPTVQVALSALRRLGTDRDTSASLLRLARALEPLLPPETSFRRSEP